MIVFFRLFGLIADVALVINLQCFTIMSWIGASLTLPGIAGIVITIGMAVDANV
jgi:preprotein translocase subunit SecD